MNLGDLFDVITGQTAKERREAQDALHRAKYEAVRKQAEMERDANEKLQQQQAEASEKLEEAYQGKAEVERRTHEEKIKLEREKMDMMKESSNAQMQMMMESNERQRLIEREGDKQRREIEKTAREDQLRMMTENEMKREKERADAKAREEQKQKEATAAINEANRSVMEMKDKTHADITRLVMENQQNKDDLMKENLKIMEAKDAANAEKLDKLTNDYQTQVKEAQETAKLREDKLHLERKEVEAKYRTDMENMSKLSKEERDKITSEYHQMIEKKDNELSKNQREKDAKMDELNKNHLADLRKAHDDYNKLQESSKAEVAKLQKEKEEVIKQSAAKQEESHKKMLEIVEKKNEQLLALTGQSAYAEAVKIKEQSEFLRIAKCGEELSPLRNFRSALTDSVTDSLELWSELEHAGDDSIEIKNGIISKSQAIKKNISEIIKIIDASRSLGEQKKLWKDEVKKLSDAAAKYARSVTREIKEEETTKSRLREMEDECEDLNKIIQNLPDMEVETFEAIINRNAQGAILSAESRGVKTAITAAKNEEKAQTNEGETESEPVVEEPQ